MRVIPAAAIFGEQLRVVFSTQFAIPVSELHGCFGQTFFNVDFPPIDSHEAAPIGLALPGHATKGAMQGGCINGAPFGLSQDF